MNIIVKRTNEYYTHSNTNPHLHCKRSNRKQLFWLRTRSLVHKSIWMKINVISEVYNFGSVNILGKCSSSNFNFIIANHPDHFIPDIQVCSGIGWLNNIVGEVQFVADLIEDFKDET